MIRLRFSIQLGYEILDQPADFIFNIHAAPTDHQVVLNESLSISQPVKATVHHDPVPRHRLLRLRAQPGPLKIAYAAEVELRHHLGQPERIEECRIADLPTEVLPYLYPSRYCESDKLQQLANELFGPLPQGYRRVEDIRAWVNRRTRFVPGCSTFTTSAIDTYQQQVGVCRDFAHLMIALCRALNIPARFCSGLDYGADPALGPTDFHAYVEVFLGGRWYIFDPSGTAIPMGFVRIGTGRDAADISFATIFGAIKSEAPLLAIEALNQPAQGYVLPRHCPEALSTDTPVGFAG
ncbi:MAG TPA: transglutaminase family protein [Myxococcota bacterium]|nr:transglutaminase family protein [Myxococcota bacterium]